MIPMAVVRALSAQLREMENAAGPRLADLIDLQPLTLYDRDCIYMAAFFIAALKDNGWGQR